MSQQIGKIVQFVRLFHSGQFHGLLVEGSKDDGVNLPGPPCFDSLAQAAQDIPPRFGTDLPQRMVCTRTRVIKKLRMSIDHPRNFDSALVLGSISNDQHLGLSESLRKGQQLRCELRTNAGGIAKQ